MAEQDTPVPEPRRLCPEAAAWDENYGFNESYLLLMPPQHRQAFRRFARTLHELEPGAAWRGRRISATREELRAALADLRVLEGFLEWIGRSPKVVSVGERDRPLAELGAELSTRVGELADRLAAALGRRPAATVREENAEEPASA